MVKVVINRKEKTGNGFTYEIFRVNIDGERTQIPNPNGGLWKISDVYAFINFDTRARPDLPLELGEGVMNDYVSYADKAEAEEREALRGDVVNR